jgi:hypothetical protein
MGTREYTWLWLLSYGAALTAFAARVSFLLFGLGTEPPNDPSEIDQWRRKRRWLILSEFSALPMFATLAVLGAAKGWVDPVSAVIAALISGALGFAFFLHAVEAIVRRRFSIDEPGK